MSLVWFLVGLGLGAAAGAWLYRSTYNKALRDDRNYQEQSYWVAQDACERAWRHLRWLSAHPRLAFRVFYRVQRITERREHIR